VGGLLLVIPLFITWFILNFIWSNFRDLLRPALDLLPGPVPGWVLAMGAALLLVALIYLVGLIGRTIIGGRLVRFWEGFLDRIPFVRAIYRIARDTTHLVAGGAHLQSSRVVLLHYPRLGVFSLGLVTGTYDDEAGEPLLAIYIPTAITPTAGFLVFVKKEEVIETDLTFEDAMKIAISAGILTKDVVQARRQASRERASVVGPAPSLVLPKNQQ
jgi:uncharacterized membrane protein